jgi:hypothetical protein
MQGQDIIWMALLPLAPATLGCYRNEWLSIKCPRYCADDGL